MLSNTHLFDWICKFLAIEVCLLKKNFISGETTHLQTLTWSPCSFMSTVN